MTCAEFERLLDQHDMDAGVRQAMQRHADDCPQCRMLLELRSLDEGETVPEEVTARWQGAIRTEKAKQAQAKRKPIAWRYLAPVMAAAAVLIAAVSLRKPITDLSTVQLPQATVSAVAQGKSVSAAPSATAAPAVPTDRQETAAGPALNTDPALSAPMVMSEETSVIPAEEAVFALEAAGSDWADDAEEAADAPAFNDADLADEAIIDDADAAINAWLADEAVPMSEEEEGPVTGLGAADDVMLQWSSSQPSEAIRSLLSAMGRQETGAELYSDEIAATLTMTLSEEEWPAFILALRQVSDYEVPEDQPWPFENDSEQITIIVYQEEE